eukprot:snap_masked-scaffold_38-processed-gene-0.26-mRNA-1 protein AED:1.00 eAED:1.00 QI:0/-1/0/0/-1/1/1/0/400
MKTTCFKLFPAGECSFHGTCVVVESIDNTTLQERCECKPGWSQSKEMSLFFLDEADIDVNQVGLCTQNNSVLTSLYIIALVSTIIAFIDQVVRIRKKKQVVRLFPLLLGFLLNIFLCAYKLSDFDGVNLGQDPLFTALVFNTILLYIASISISFQRYIFYILKRTKLGNQELVKRAKLFATISNYVLLSDFIIYQMQWVSVFMPRKTGYNVIRIFFGLTLFRNQYTNYMVYTLFGTITRDLRTYLVLAKSSSKTTVLAAEKNYKFAKKSLTGLSFLQKLCYFYGVMCFMFTFLPSIFPFIMYTLGYQVPLMFIVWSLLSVVTTYTRSKEKTSSTTSTLPMKTNTAVGSKPISSKKKSFSPFSGRNRLDTAGLVVSQIEGLPMSTDKEFVYESKESKDLSI